MIGDGWLPGQPRPLDRRDTLAYTRRRNARRRLRRTQKAAPGPITANTEDMVFEPRAELPVATVRPRSLFVQVATDVARWLRARGSWVRPRAIPLAVAALSLVAITAAANYLTDVARHGWEPTTCGVAPAQAPPTSFAR